MPSVPPISQPRSSRSLALSSARRSLRVGARKLASSAGTRRLLHVVRTGLGSDQAVVSQPRTLGPPIERILAVLVSAHVREPLGVVHNLRVDVRVAVPDEVVPRRVERAYLV